MKKYTLLSFAALLCSHIFGQPYQIGHTTITLVDASRNNRSIPTEIYYPADISGTDVPFTTTNNAKFPILSFGHGFVMTWDAYQNIWETIVPEGFIIAFPKTEGSLSPSHIEFAKDLCFVISQLTALGQNDSSFFYNRIDSMNCIMGHSMGGGSAFLAAQFSSEVKTLATFAAAETNPSAVQAATSLSIPSLIFAGGNDCVTPPGANQLPMYDSLQSICKTFISVNGGSHCQMANSNFLCSFGEGSCAPQPTITRAAQHIVINRYLLPWLKYELKGDCIAGAQFDSLIITDTSIVYHKTCLLCNTFSVSDLNAPVAISVFPNPFNDKIFIQCSKSASTLVKVDLYFMNGSKIFSKTFLNVSANEALKLNLKENMPKGIYVLKVSIDGQYSVWKIVRQGE